MFALANPASVQWAMGYGGPDGTPDGVSVATAVWTMLSQPRMLAAVRQAEAINIPTNTDRADLGFLADIKLEYCSIEKELT